jgi:hypothetical protein
MNRDLLNSVPYYAATTAAFAALDGIQSMPPAQQLAGVALLFTEMCDGVGIDPSEIIDQSRRRARNALSADSLTQRTEMKSLKAYVKGELA